MARRNGFRRRKIRRKSETRIFEGIRSAALYWLSPCTPCVPCTMHLSRAPRCRVSRIPCCNPPRNRARRLLLLPPPPLLLSSRCRSVIPGTRGRDRTEIRLGFPDRPSEDESHCGNFAESQICLNKDILPDCMQMRAWSLTPRILVSRLRLKFQGGGGEGGPPRAWKFRDTHGRKISRGEVPARTDRMAFFNSEIYSSEFIYLLDIDLYFLSKRLEIQSLSKDSIAIRLDARL